MRAPAWISRMLPAVFGQRRPPGRARRQFDAAQQTRLLHSWRMATQSINRELRGDLDALRRRARDLAKNEPLAKKYLSMVVTNVVGPAGFTLQVRVADGAKPDTLANNAIEAGWREWCKPGICEVSGRLSFTDLARAIMRAIARDGESLVRILPGEGPYGIALQLLDIERLDTTFNQLPDTTHAHVIMGVEIDDVGRAVAYYLFDPRYGEDPQMRKRERVPADNLRHLFVVHAPEQVRGIPWMHASMVRIHHLKGYEEAAIIASRIGASKMGFFTNIDGVGNNADQLKGMADGEDAAGLPFTEADPGQFGMLPEGVDFKPFNPDYPHAQYDMFTKAAKRDIGSGLNAEYNSLANDLEGVNFSSIRSGTIEERDSWMQDQNWFIGIFLDDIYDRWLRAALLAGMLTMPNGSALPAAKFQKFRAHEFLGRRWQWVDPLKDMNANVVAIDNGLASPYQIAAQQGADAEDVLDDIARFQAAAKAKGVTLHPGGRPANASDAGESVTPADGSADTAPAGKPAAKKKP